MSIKKMCSIAMLTALYVVLGTFVKINIIGNISLDLGYLAFVVALCEFGMLGTFVGVVGCSLESLLFSAYGFSIGWAVANLIIGLICGHMFEKTDRLSDRIIWIAFSTSFGLFVAKTFIECALYSIPLLVKLPKSATAWLMDAIVMIFGLLFYNRLNRRKL